MSLPILPSNLAPQRSDSLGGAPLIAPQDPQSTPQNSEKEPLNELIQSLLGKELDESTADNVCDYYQQLQEIFTQVMEHPDGTTAIQNLFRHPGGTGEQQQHIALKLAEYYRKKISSTDLSSYFPVIRFYAKAMALAPCSDEVHKKVSTLFFQAARLLLKQELKILCENWTEETFAKAVNLIKQFKVFATHANGLEEMRGDLEELIPHEERDAYLARLEIELPDEASTQYLVNQLISKRYHNILTRFRSFEVDAKTKWLNSLKQEVVRDTQRIMPDGVGEFALLGLGINNEQETHDPIDFAFCLLLRDGANHQHFSLFAQLFQLQLMLIGERQKIEEFTFTALGNVLKHGFNTDHDLLVKDPFQGLVGTSTQLQMLIHESAAEDILKECLSTLRVRHAVNLLNNDHALFGSFFNELAASLYRNLGVHAGHLLAQKNGQKNIQRILNQTSDATDEQKMLAQGLASFYKMRTSEELDSFVLPLEYYAKALAIDPANEDIHAHASSCFFSAVQLLLTDLPQSVVTVCQSISKRYPKFLTDFRQEVLTKEEVYGRFLKRLNTIENWTERSFAEITKFIDDLQPYMTQVDELRTLYETLKGRLPASPREDENSFINRLEKIMGTLSQEALDSIDQQDREKPILTQKEVFDRAVRILRDTVRDTLTILGPSPCEYDIRLMGELGRQESGYYPQLEYFILISDEKHRPYFLKFAQLLELQMILMGETQSTQCLTFTTKNSRKTVGFHIADQGNPSRHPEKLIRTPGHMVDHLRELKQAKDYRADPLGANLLFSYQISGTSVDLYSDFETEAEAYLDRKSGTSTFRQLFALECLRYRSKYFRIRWKTPFARDVKTINLHGQYTFFIDGFLRDLALYFNLSHTGSQDLVDNLVAKHVLNRESGETLKKIMVDVFKIRLRLEKLYRAQNGVVSFPRAELPQVNPMTNDEFYPLARSYCEVLFPLYRSLRYLTSKTMKDKFEDNFRFVNLLVGNYQHLLRRIKKFQEDFDQTGLNMLREIDSDTKAMEDAELQIDIWTIQRNAIASVIKKEPGALDQSVNQVQTKILEEVRSIVETRRANQSTILGAKDSYISSDGKQEMINRKNRATLLQDYITDVEAKIQTALQVKPIRPGMNFVKLCSELDVMCRTKRLFWDQTFENRTKKTMNYDDFMKGPVARELQDKIASLATDACTPANIWDAYRMGDLEFIDEHMRRNGIATEASIKAFFNTKNNEGKAAIHVAAENGHYALMSFLIQRGANVNLVSGDGTVKLEAHFPLYYAAQKGFLGIAKLLLNAGAKVDTIGENNRTPLHTAVHNGHVDVVEFLLKNGANPNLQAEVSRLTPLHVALINGHIEVFFSLISIPEVDVMLTTTEQETPLWYAVKFGVEDAVRSITDHPSWKLERDPTNPNHFSELVKICPAGDVGDRIRDYLQFLQRTRVQTHVNNNQF